MDRLFSNSASIESRPVIGLTCDILVLDNARRHALRDSYVSAIVNAGGAPLLIPCTGDEASAYALYKCLDGLLLTGGGDIDPAIYGETEGGTELDSISPARDSTELMLARWALRDNLPILGICRGQQTLNVAAGGTLYQDIPSQVPHSGLDHRGSTHTLDRSLLAHQVIVTPDSKLAQIFGTTQLTVNSLHHQAVKEVGAGLRVVGAAPDGLPEALEGTGCDFVVAVQWHPEELWRKQEASASLFKTFVESVRRSSRKLTAV